MGSAISVLAIAASVAKWTAILLVLLNIHSFPLTWHIRHWWRLIPLHLNTLLTSPHAVSQAAAHDALRRGGARMRVTQRRRALPDDCDFNMHLSNSCYAKNSDISRSQWIFAAVTPAMAAGVHMALGASHYTFAKEIRMGSGYEMETRAVGWGDKWIYLVTEFLIPAPPAKKARKGARVPTAQSSPTSSSTTPGTRTPASFALPSLEPTAESARATLAGVTESLQSADSSPSPAVALVDSLRTRPARADGRIVAAYGVVEMCFKLGRVTIPPRIALHLAGLSPDAAQQARAAELTKNIKAARKWLAGGWREAADADSIGADIEAPGSMVEALGSDEKAAQDGEGQASKVARAMERVGLGLADAVPQ